MDAGPSCGAAEDKGILLVPCTVKGDPKDVGHYIYIIVNAWGKFIMDNNEDSKKLYISYTDVDLTMKEGAVAFFHAMKVMDICQVDVIMVPKKNLPAYQLGQVRE